MERTGVQYVNPRALLLAALIAIVAFAIGAIAVLFAPLGEDKLPAPEEVLAISAERFHDEPESIEGTFGAEVKMEGLEIRYDGEFSFAAPDRIHVTIDSVGTKTEILLTGGDSYLLPDSDDEWYRLESDWEGLDPDTLELFLESRGFLHYGNVANRLLRLEQLPDESLDGRTYLHYWGFVELQDLADVALTGLTGQAPAPAYAGTEGGPAETHLWLDRDTFLPRRVEMSGEWTLDDLTVSQSLTFDFSNYDADVTVPDAPADARPLVQSLQPGGILGLRCGYATKFLRERYDLPEGRGCVTLRVDSPSAAEQAGFQLGDKIVEMDGIPITSGRQFSLLFEDVPGSGHHSFVVQRGDEELTLEVDLAHRAGEPEEDPYFYYLRAKSLSAESLDLEADLDRIVADYTRQIDQDPDFELPYVYRGDMLIGRDNEAARADLEHALALDPALTEAHRALAQVAADERDFDAAIDQIDRSTELNGCGDALESWDLDCAEDITNRTGFYLARLQEGDDQIIERDLDALEGVIFYEPMLVWGRAQLAFLRGDDATTRELAEQFVEMPLTRISSYLEDRQFRVEKEFVAAQDFSAFAVPTWIVSFVNTFDYPQDPVTETRVTGSSESGFSFAIRAELPSAPTQVSTLSGDLWRGSYRLASFQLAGVKEKYFHVTILAFTAERPTGSYELRVYLDGEFQTTVTLDVTNLP
ncbi:MAG: hypothetical protein WD379_06725 [Dehalococcoidia bacterium]